MKTNIQRINYEGILDKNGKCWRWKEYCDICGADCGKSDFQMMFKPDREEKDYCISCLRRLVDEKINEKLLKTNNYTPFSFIFSSIIFSSFPIA